MTGDFTEQGLSRRFCSTDWGDMMEENSMLGERSRGTGSGWEVRGVPSRRRRGRGDQKAAAGSTTGRKDLNDQGEAKAQDWGTTGCGREPIRAAKGRHVLPFREDSRNVILDSVGERVRPLSKSKKGGEKRGSGAREMLA